MMRTLLILLVVGMCSLSFGQSWSNILTSSRAIDWTQAGLPATFPDGETTPNPWTPPTRTQCGSTVNPSGDTSGATDTTNINNAYSSCTSGKYVLLAAGTFYLNADVFFQGNSKNVTVRGAGANSTIIQANGHPFWLGGGGAGSPGSLTATSYSKGTTTVTVASNPPSVNTVGLFMQCNTGWSGATCATGASTDNGNVWVCADGGCSNSTQGGTNKYQQQFVYITGVSGNNVTFTPGLYAPNWSSNSSATLSSGGFGTGIGLEDMSLINGRVGISGCFICWAKGLRVITNNSSGTVSITSSAKSLIFNNYFTNTYLLNNYPVIFAESSGQSGVSDSLILNNIIHNTITEGGGSTANVIFGYNYDRDTVSNDNYAGDYQHLAADFYELREGNQWGAGRDDDTHGSHDFSTYFRNYFGGTDVPLTLTGNANAVQIGQWSRFSNVVGNVIGWRQPGGTVFATNYVNSVPNLFWINSGGGDALTSPSLMRWGNYTICSGNSHCNTTNWDSAEVPTSTVMPTSTFPNAGAWQNAVPSNHNLPCSFFLPTFTSTSCSPLPSGGTGLSWWKVCDTWTTFPTSCSHFTTQPFPPIGPDVTNGRTDSDGFAYDIPAAVAWKNLPIDTSFQSSYTITASSWASTDGGTETLTFASGTLPQCQVGNVCHLQGGFQITTSNQTACTGGLSELLIKSAGPGGAMPTFITYSLTSNPGSNACTGTMKFPDIRQFDERVFQLDSAGLIFSPASIAFNPQPISTTSSGQVLTITNNSAGTINLTSEALQTGTQFAISANDCGASLASSASCHVTTTFTPTSAGTKNDNIVITSSGPSSPQSVALSGIGLATPVISPVTGSYSGTQTITITDATAGATIYYTLNGTTPTSSSTIYSGAFSLASTATVKAVAYLNGVASGIDTEVITIAGTNNNLTTTITHAVLTGKVTIN